MSDDLKPCPFCGGNDIGSTATNKHSLAYVCTSCEARGPYAEGSGLERRHWIDAAEKWNTRAQDEAAMRAGYEMAAKEAREIGVHLRRFDLVLNDMKEGK